jgi:hypothetical protein
MPKPKKPDHRKPGVSPGNDTDSVKPPRPLEDFEIGTPMFGIGKRKIKRKQAKG